MNTPDPTTARPEIFFAAYTIPHATERRREPARAPQRPPEAGPANHDFLALCARPFAPAPRLADVRSR